MFYQIFTQKHTYFTCFFLAFLFQCENSFERAIYSRITQERPIEVGAATAVAIHVLHYARNNDFLPEENRGSCRILLPEEGSLQVQSHATYAVKTPEYAQIIHEDRLWQRDQQGEIASLIRISGLLPDGRFTFRTSETRLIDGQIYRAIDGRFVLANSVVDAEIQDESRLLVDSLLAQISWNETGWENAQENGFCEGFHSEELPPLANANVYFSGSDRFGNLQWNENEKQLFVNFSEYVSFDVSAIQVPEIWEISADESSRNISQFVEEGFHEGWLLTSRQVYDQNMPQE